ncbi:FAD-dependent thymidylate synthase [Candidatus Woesearchaeota archaeon]|nr:FAD-dependent thymidylate synthase [Candidatus Woesearchaeota archaeon]
MGGLTTADVLKEVIDTDGNLKPGFSGIGRFRGRTDYTADEKTVLRYFFTNIESNVYCATDNMPNELWALVMGQYARSSMTGRDRLLKLFTDMEEKGEGLPVSELASMIRDGADVSEALKKHLSKAGKFIETWGVKYGHASLRDSGVIRMCMEGVSQGATNILESAREGAYQEQSTRALPYTKENIGIPYEIRGTQYEQMLLDLQANLINLYEEIYGKVLVHLKQKYAHMRVEADEKIIAETGNKEAVLSDREWDSIIAGKAFDVARYLLPLNMTTSLGMTLNTRRFQDKLSAWQSHDLMEIRVLGRAAQIESMKISPTLMKYGNKSEFRAAIPAKLRNLNKKYIDSNPAKPKFEYKHYDVQSKMISCPDDLQELVLASILLNGSDGSTSLADLKKMVSDMSFEEKREIAESVTLGKQSHEIFPKLMECGAVVFERLYDLGAFRDLQRQRGDRQQYNKYSVIGYNMPKEVEEIGLKDEFVTLMVEVKQFYDLLRKEGHPAAAQYVPVMANVIRHVTTKDVVQCFYEAKLRAQPAGIDSYRSIAQQEISQILEVMPVFKGLIPYDEAYYELGRLPETVNGKIRRYKPKAAAQ